MNPNLLKKAIEVSFALFDKNRLEFDQRCFVVCCAFLKNRLIVIETNSNKTDPNNLRNPLFCKDTGRDVHKSRRCAEWNAIKRIKNTSNIRFNKISLINVRITRNGRIGLSKCCGSCANLVEFFQPKEIFYTLDSEKDNPQFQEYTDY